MVPHFPMFNRREAVAKAMALLTVLPELTRGQGGTGTGSTPPLTIPFQFAQGRGSLLVHAQINGKPSLLIVDTGSSHTILRPAAAGVDPRELAAPRARAGIIGDAVGKVVTLQLGERMWARPVSVMDLSQALSAYREKIDGLLGMDFFLEFSEAVIRLKERVISFIP